MREAAELLARTVGADGAQELVVIRHGRMIFHGDDIDNRHGVWSATKSFTSTVLGLLIADGKCTLDTRVSDVLPELKAYYPDVTLRHFTTMTSGYRAVGDATTGSYKHGPSNTPFVPNPQPLFSPPGSQYAYWDSAMNTFALALTKIAGEPIEQLCKRRVADLIGMKNWDWGDYATVDSVIVNGGSGNGNNPQFIIRDCRNVHIFYFKVEAGTISRANAGDANTPCRIAQSQDVRVYCMYGVVRNLGTRPMLEVINSTDIVVDQIKTLSPGTFPHLVETWGHETSTVPSSQTCALFVRDSKGKPND